MYKMKHNRTKIPFLYFYSKTNEMHQILKFILFCSNTLHVSDGLSVRYQESGLLACGNEMEHLDLASKQ
jgi:hypothetical protein